MSKQIMVVVKMLKEKSTLSIFVGNPHRLFISKSMGEEKCIGFEIGEIYCMLQF